MTEEPRPASPQSSEQLPLQPPADAKEPILDPLATGERFDESVATEPSAPRPSRFPRITAFRALVASTVVLGLAALLLGLMVFAPTIAPIKLGSTRSAVDAQVTEEIKEVAGRFARNFVTISYRTIDADFERIIKDTTGSFRRQIERIPDVIRGPFAESEGVSRGRVAEVTILSRVGETATVEVVVRRTIQNKSTPSPRSVSHRIELTLVSTAGGWKVADAASLPSATGDNS